MPISLIGAGVSGIAGVVGNIAGAGDRAKAQQAQTDALNRWLAIHLPDPAQQQIELQRYQQTGQFSPQLQQTFQQQQTELNNINVDPATRNAQMAALSRLSDIGSSNGMDAQAKYDTQQSVDRSNSNEAGQRGAILQNFAARGVGGSGAELAADLQASQGDANQQATAGLQASATAQKRALDALSSGATLAGTVRSADYNQAANAASAQDIINNFNAKNSQAVAGANTAATNDAGLYNAKNAQDISNRNTGVENTQETYNKGLAQKQFEDQVQVDQGAGNAAAGVSKADNAAAQSTSDMWSGIGGALSTAASGYAQSQNKTPATPKDPISGGYDSMSQADKDSYDKAMAGN